MIEGLLTELCARLGYCDALLDESLWTSPPETIDAFTDAVIVAEGLDPVFIATDARREVRQCVEKWFDRSGGANHSKPL